MRERRQRDEPQAQQLSQVSTSDRRVESVFFNQRPAIHIRSSAGDVSLPLDDMDLDMRRLGVGRSGRSPARRATNLFDDSQLDHDRLGRQ